MFSEISTLLLCIPDSNRVQLKKKYKIQVEVFKCTISCYLIGDISIGRNLIATLKMEVVTPF